MTWTGKNSITKPTGLIEVTRGGRRRRIYAPSRQRARDVRILKGLADGRTQREIATDEEISYEYVKQILTRLRLEFGAQTSHELVAIAMRQGVLE